MLIRATCAERAWPAPVTDCLHAAVTTAAIETCLGLLPAGEKQHLEDRLRVLEAPLAAEDQKEKAAGDVLFEDALAQKHPSFGSSPECAAYRAAVKTTMTVMLACRSVDSLELFAAQQFVLAQVKKLDGFLETEKPAQCTAVKAELAAEPALRCAH